MRFVLAEEVCVGRPREEAVPRPEKVGPSSGSMSVEGERGSSWFSFAQL